MKFVPVVSEPFLGLTKGFTMHMAEAPLVHNNSGYQWFYANRPEGHTLILDNGTALSGHGPSMSIDKVLSASKLVQADEIVVPDVMYSTDETLSLAQTLVPLVPPSKVFLVPQGDTMRGWLRCASEMLGKYKFKVLGVPKHLDKLPGGRTAALGLLKERWPNLGEHKTLPHVHLLGIWNDPVELLWLARRFPWVRSVDSSAPCAYGQRNLGLVEGYDRLGKVLFDFWSNDEYVETHPDEPMRRLHSRQVSENLAHAARMAQGSPPRS